MTITMSLPTRCVRTAATCCARCTVHPPSFSVVISSLHSADRGARELDNNGGCGGRTRKSLDRTAAYKAAGLSRCQNPPLPVCAEGGGRFNPHSRCSYVDACGL